MNEQLFQMELVEYLCDKSASDLTDSGKSPDICVNPAPAELPAPASAMVRSDSGQCKGEHVITVVHAENKRACEIYGKVSLLLFIIAWIMNMSVY